MKGIENCEHLGKDLSVSRICMYLILKSDELGA